MSPPKVITPPAQIISTPDAKLHLRVTQAVEDTLVVAYLAAARQQAQDYAQYAIGEQTLELALDAFPKLAPQPTSAAWPWADTLSSPVSTVAGLLQPPAPLRLPMGKVDSVTSVTYLDTNGVQQTLDPATYVLDDYSVPNALICQPGYAWPATYWTRNAVKVRYVAGDLPDAVKAAVLLIMQALYQRGDGADDLMATAHALLDASVKVWAL